MADEASHRERFLRRKLTEAELRLECYRSALASWHHFGRTLTSPKTLLDAVEFDRFQRAMLDTEAALSGRTNEDPADEQPAAQ